MSQAGINRREALRWASAAAWGGGLLGAGGVSTPGAAAADAHSGNAERIALQFTDPIWNREASARLEADTAAGKQVHGSASGVLNAVVDGQKVRPLLRFEVFSSTRVLRQADGSYQRLSREVVFYRDPDTRQFLDEWVNPYSGEKVRVVEIANDPFNWKIAEFFPDPPSYGGLNKDKPPKRPLLLNWTLLSDEVVGLESDIDLFYPSALQPEKWPRESPGKMSQVSEFFRYFIRRADLENPQCTHVPSMGTWVRITPWLPWMLMDQAQGHMLYVGTMRSHATLDAVSADVLARVRQRYPQYLNAPDTWQEPSLSSLEHYAREQKPAAPKKP